MTNQRCDGPDDDVHVQFKMVSYIKCRRIYSSHDYEGGIEKSVPRITDWHLEACRVMTIGNCEGRIFLSHPHTNYGFLFLFTTKYLIYIG